MSLTNRALSQATGFDRGVIVLDPAHGGADEGARIDEHTSEKEVAASLAAKLQRILQSNGVSVVMTHEGDTDGGTSNQRAEVANRSRAVACLLLHASSRRNGLLIGTSGLKPLPAVGSYGAGDSAAHGVAWARAQERYVGQSGALANKVGTELVRAGIPTMMMHVAVPPLDNLTCPAVLVEMGGIVEGETSSTAADDHYQQRVAESIAAALQVWRNQAQTADSLRPETVSR